MVSLFSLRGFVRGVAVAMNKHTRRGSCCCRSCKGIFDSEADFELHLSCDGYCRGGADRVVREIAWIILNSRRVARANHQKL